MRRTLVLLFVALCSSLVVASPATAQPAPQDSGPEDAPTNVILMVPDGFGPASATMARDYLRWRDGTTSLVYDSLQGGSVRTFSADSRITDSAAGATAFATGHKTNNGYIAVDTTGKPLGTLLEAAERKGMATGLVATSRITHATPASFSAHVPDRWKENEIAAQQLTKDIEVLLGGGRRHFLPESRDGSARSDSRNLLVTARQNGYQIVETADELSRAEDTPLLGLFSLGHMSYEIDRGSQQPSLETMTTTALDLLSQEEDGYFLMVEGSRIDHAGHINDAAAHLHDILAFNAAVEAAVEQASTDENTLVVVVPDHETGGLTLARNQDGEGIYSWHPNKVAKVSASNEALADSILALRQSDASSETIKRRITETVTNATGVSTLTDSQLAPLLKIEDEYELSKALAPIVSRPALVGWTTYGHTAVDVNLYAYGPGARHFAGNRDNTYIGQTLAELLGVDLSQVTRSLETTEATGE